MTTQRQKDAAAQLAQIYWNAWIALNGAFAEMHAADAEALKLQGVVGPMETSAYELVSIHFPEWKPHAFGRVHLGLIRLPNPFSATSSLQFFDGIIKP